MNQNDLAGHIQTALEIAYAAQADTNSAHEHYILGFIIRSLEVAQDELTEAHMEFEVDIDG